MDNNDKKKFAQYDGIAYEKVPGDTHIHVIQYLDDFCIITKPAHIAVIKELFLRLGLFLYKRKCIWTLALELEYLGFNLNFMTGIITIPCSFYYYFWVWMSLFS